MKEIQSFKEFYASRSKAGGDGVNPSLLASFKTSLVCQINNTASLTMEDGTAVNAALNDAPYGAELLQEIQQAIDCKVGMAVTAKKPRAGKPGAVKQQTLKHIWNYPTQADWDVLLDAKRNFSSKASCLVHRMCVVGCSHPDEQSLKWALALLLMCSFDELPPPQVRLDKLADLKSMVHAERKTFDELPFIAVYPEKPQELPQAVWAHGYEDAAPVAKEVPGISAIAAKKIPLRRNNKLLAKEEGQGNTWKAAVKKWSKQRWRPTKLTNLAHIVLWVLQAAAGCWVEANRVLWVLQAAVGCWV